MGVRRETALVGLAVMQNIACDWIDTQRLKGVHTPLMTPLQRFPSNHTRSTCAASKQRAHPLTLPD